MMIWPEDRPAIKMQPACKPYRVMDWIIIAAIGLVIGGIIGLWVIA